MTDDSGRQTDYEEILTGLKLNHSGPLVETHFPGARTCIECETWEMACLLGLFSFPKTNRNPRDGWIPEIHFHFPFEFQVLTSLDMARELISFSNFGHDRDVPVSSRQRLRQQPSGLILDPQLMAVDNLLTSRFQLS